MSDPIVGLLGFALSLGMIALGVPIAVALGIVGIGGYALLNGIPGALFVTASAPFESLFPYSLSVIPLFLMMGVFSSRCGLSTDLFLAAQTLVGRFRGGLAIATIAASAGFGAICGSSLATVATIGRVALPEMRRAGYDDRLAAASVAAGGTLGVMIPPSILLIIYGLLTEQSIGQLFSAAILPGLLGLGLYAACVTVSVRVNPALARPVAKGQRIDFRALSGPGRSLPSLEWSSAGFRPVCFPRPRLRPWGPLVLLPWPPSGAAWTALRFGWRCAKP